MSRSIRSPCPSFSRLPENETSPPACPHTSQNQVKAQFIIFFSPRLFLLRLLCSLPLHASILLDYKLRSSLFLPQFLPSASVAIRPLSLSSRLSPVSPVIWVSCSKCVLPQSIFLTVLSTFILKTFTNVYKHLSLAQRPLLAP